MIAVTNAVAVVWSYKKFVMRKCGAVRCEFFNAGIERERETAASLAGDEIGNAAGTPVVANDQFLNPGACNLK